MIRFRDCTGVPQWQECEKKFDKWDAGMDVNKNPGRIYNCLVKKTFVLLCRTDGLFLFNSSTEKV